MTPRANGVLWMQRCHSSFPSKVIHWKYNISAIFFSRSDHRRFILRRSCLVSHHSLYPVTYGSRAGFLVRICIFVIVHYCFFEVDRRLLFRICHFPTCAAGFDHKLLSCLNSASFAFFKCLASRI